MPKSKHDPACCWTCRLRRKKCDKTYPECSSCKSLGITCYRSAEKPAWMDGGRRQRTMSERLKERVRRNAEYQREGIGVADMVWGNSNGNGELCFVLGERNVADSGNESMMAGDQISVKQSSGLGDSNDVLGMTEPIPSASIRSSSGSQTFSFPQHPDDQESLDLGSATTSVNASEGADNASTSLQCLVPTFFDGEDYETTFLMKYLDDVFPFLFPFYRPSIMETGRSWILTLMRRSNVALHAALSLTSYFFTVMLTDIYPGEFEPCKREIWSRLGGQTDSYFERIRQEVEQLRSQLGVMTTRDRARSMGSIIQALIFEIALGRSRNWNIHLTAALGIFDEILQYQRREGEKAMFLALLNEISKPAFYSADSRHYIWTSEQAGFRFFMALLVFIDVVGSTAMERAPYLLEHYPMLLSTDDNDRNGLRARGTLFLKLSSYYGCQNWVITAVAETAALAQWKKDAKAKANLSGMQLASRAQTIQEKLDQGILRLEHESSGISALSKNEQNLQFYQGHLRMPPLVPIEMATSVWAHAARIYLQVVVSGWQPSNTEIRTGVHKTLTLLQNIHSPSHLRTFTWPFVVAGCLAEPGDEQRQFQEMLDSKSDVEMFGAMKEARDILRKVWDMRGDVDRDNWDVAACLCVLGFPALLV